MVFAGGTEPTQRGFFRFRSQAGREPGRGLHSDWWRGLGAARHQRFGNGIRDFQLAIADRAGDDQGMTEIRAGRGEQIFQAEFHVAGMLSVWVKVGRLNPFQASVHWMGTLCIARATRRLGLMALSVMPPR